MDETTISSLITLIFAIVAAFFKYQSMQTAGALKTVNAQVVDVQNTAGSVLSIIEGGQKLINDYNEKQAGGLNEEDMKCLVADVEAIFNNSAIKDLKKVLSN